MLNVFLSENGDTPKSLLVRWWVHHGTGSKQQCQQWAKDQSRYHLFSVLPRQNMLRDYHGAFCYLVNSPVKGRQPAMFYGLVLFRSFVFPLQRSSKALISNRSCTLMSHQFNSHHVH